jgi:hypothetical protein
MELENEKWGSKKKEEIKFLSYGCIQKESFLQIF